MRDDGPFEGGCSCGHLRYRIHGAPLIVHCCHCRWCQRETGSAFAINALIESDRVETLASAPQSVTTPSESGKGQRIARCPECRIAVWSHYATAVGDRVSFVRVGTLDQPARLPPDIHIYAESKQPWLTLPPNSRSVPLYYRRSEYWPADSIQRFERLR